MVNTEITYTTVTGQPKGQTLQKMVTMYSSIFEDADVPFFLERISNQTDVLSILALHGEILVGFKTGYQKTSDTFYSWIGGVLPPYRKQGIAQQLMTLQEQWAKNKGYKILQTKSMNRFKPMMILNLKNGFEITKLYTNAKQQTKVVFEKRLIGS